MNAQQKDGDVGNWIYRRFGIMLDCTDMRTLRRAQLTLHRWAELECGDSDNYKSWSIERDENSTGNEPYMCIYLHDSSKVRRYRIPDRENGALRRVAALCTRLGLYYYHQTDPRGCALYVSNEPLNEQNYTNGFAVTN